VCIVPGVSLVVSLCAVKDGPHSFSAAFCLSACFARCALDLELDDGDVMDSDDGEDALTGSCSRRFTLLLCHLGENWHELLSFPTQINAQEASARRPGLTAATGADHEAGHAR